MRLALIISTCVLYPCSYAICEHFYPDDMNKWDLLRHVLYSFTLLLVGSIGFFKADHTENWVKVFTAIFIGGMIAGDLIDKCMGIYHFSWIDILLILLTAIFAYKKHVWNPLKKSR